MSAHKFALAFAAAFSGMGLATPARADIEYCPMYVAWQWNGIYYHWCLQCGDGPIGQGAYVCDSRAHAVGQDCSLIVDKIGFMKADKNGVRFTASLDGVLPTKKLDLGNFKHVGLWDQEYPTGDAGAAGNAGNFMPFVPGVVVTREELVKVTAKKTPEGMEPRYFRVLTVRVEANSMIGVNKTTTFRIGQEVATIADETKVQLKIREAKRKGTPTNDANAKRHHKIYVGSKENEAFNVISALDLEVPE